MTIKLTFNGVAASAEPGMSVLEAARANGVDIPTLCYHPALPAVGACRLCVVEIDNMRGFPTACTVPVAEGMVVRTESEALQQMRRETLALILSEHPYTCLMCSAGCDAYQVTVRKAAVTTGCQYCPRNGQCELQDLVERVDLKEMPYPIRYRGLPVERDDPFFDRDYNLCILCGRCIRACQDVRHVGVLSFVNRGSETIVGTAFGRSHLETDCQFCGACVDVCPTGALFDKRGRWEGVPDGARASICPFCAVGCAIDLQTKRGSVIRAVGRREGPSNEGQLCVRGRFGVPDVVHNLSRLKRPVVRRNDRLIEVTWDEALDVATEGLAAIGRDELAVLVSPSAPNEECYLLQRLARAAMGTNNVSVTGVLPEGEGAERTAGFASGLASLGTTAVRELRDAGAIVAIGTNVFESHPIVGLEIRHARSRGAPFVAVDVRRTTTTRGADLWLQPRASTDHVLIAGLATALQLAGAADAGAPDVQQAAATAGVAQDDLTAAAALLRGRQPIFVLYGSGVTHQPAAARTEAALKRIAADLPGVRLLCMPGEGNIVGAHDMGVHPALLPGYVPVGDEAAARRFAEAWRVELPPAPGLAYGSIRAAIADGRLRGLYVSGALPPWPELGQLDCLVIQDVVISESARHALAVLPLATFAELDGTMTNLEGRVQRLRRAIQPPGLARPGWAIARDLGRRLVSTAPAADGWAFATADDVLAEIAALVGAYSELRLDGLEDGGHVRRFVGPEGTPPARFSLDHVPGWTDDEFPLALVTERNLAYYYGICLTEDVRGMNLLKQEEVLHLSPNDAARLGVADGELVAAVSAHGRAECIVAVSAGLPDGLVFCSFNRVVPSPLFAGLAPTTKISAIRVEPAVG